MGSDPTKVTPSFKGNSSFESRYYDFMGFDTSVLLERYRTYPRFFDCCKSVLDIGCGRGEFLQLLKECGIKGTGVDCDDGMVRKAQGKGLRVVQEDLFSFLLRTHEKFDGIFAGHIIEHLTPENVLRFLEACKRVLNPGGAIVLVTPNPASLNTHLSEFWRDATHVRPYNREIVEFFLNQSGFKLNQSGINPGNYDSPFSDLCRPGNPPYEWPPPYTDISHKLFSLYPPLPPGASLWRRILKFIHDVTIRKMLLHKGILIQEHLRRLTYQMITLYAPNEIFCAGKLANGDIREEVTITGSISVVIPNYNGRQFIDGCLISLERQTVKDLEIIVVDNRSTDGSVEYLKNRYPKVKVIPLSSNTGFSHAANIGIKASSSNLVFLLNMDTEVDCNCIREILIAQERYPDNSFFSCKMVNYHRRDILDGTGDCVPRNLNAYRRGQFWKDSGDFLLSDHVFGACAGAAVYRKSALQEIDFFDEDFFCFYEDVDLSMRLQIAGHTCRYLPGVVVYHIGSGSTEAALTPFIARNLSRNKIFILVKNITTKYLFKNLWLHIRGEISRALHFTIHGMLLSYIAGMAEALVKVPLMLKKRKKILGSAKVSPEYLNDIMKESEQWNLPYRIVKKNLKKLKTK